MISEGLCDTGDWSDDAKKFNKLYFKITNYILKLKTVEKNKKTFKTSYRPQTFER